MNVQTRVAEYVKRLGIKQAEISRKTGITPKRLSSIMNCDSSRMTADEYELICIAIEKEPNDFMGVSDGDNC